jgi:hypothetical protein
VLAALVQHHPDREELLPGLLSRLGPAPVVVADPEPGSSLRSPWRTYRACLERAAQSGAPSALVVQDDCEPCPLGFWEAACRAAARHPDCVVVLFVPGAHRLGAARVRASAARGRPYVNLEGTWLPVVAVIWPTALAPRVLEWVDGQHWPPKFRADDEILGRAVRALRAPVVAVAPSLVQHQDVTPSLIGLRHRAGRDVGRVAACWIGAADARLLDL